MLNDHCFVIITNTVLKMIQRSFLKNILHCNLLKIHVANTFNLFQIFPSSVNAWQSPLQIFPTWNDAFEFLLLCIKGELLSLLKTLLFEPLLLCFWTVLRDFFMSFCSFNFCLFHFVNTWLHNFCPLGLTQAFANYIGSWPSLCVTMQIRYGQLVPHRFGSLHLVRRNVKTGFQSVFIQLSRNASRPAKNFCFRIYIQKSIASWVPKILLSISFPKEILKKRKKSQVGYPYLIGLSINILNCMK